MVNMFVPKSWLAFLADYSVVSLSYNYWRKYEHFFKNATHITKVFCIEVLLLSLATGPHAKHSEKLHMAAPFKLALPLCSV